MRYLPKILRDLFAPDAVAPGHPRPGTAPAALSPDAVSSDPVPPEAVSPDPFDTRVAALVARLGDRMIAAETGTVAAHRDRVETLFAEFGQSLEDSRPHGC